MNVRPIRRARATHPTTNTGYRSFLSKASFDDAVDSTTFTVEALDAYPDSAVSALAAGLNKLLAQEVDLYTATRKARRATVRANARVRVADSVADDELAEFEKDLLGAVRQDRQSEVFRKFFPDASPKAIIAMTLGPEVPELERIAAVLGSDGVPAELLKKNWVKRMGSIIERGKAALDERRAAMLAQSEASAAKQRWIELADRARRALDGALTTYAAEKDLDADFNDRFFPDSSGKKSSKKDKGDAEKKE